MSLKAVLLDALFPKRLACCVCDEEALTDEKGTCAVCKEKLRLCPRLSALKDTDGFAAGLLYTEGIKQAMHRFKYGDAQYLAEFFASFLTLPESWEADAFVPVPLHGKRLRKRGYNQSALIAEQLSIKTGICLNEALLRREKSARTQTALNADERRKNVKNVFTAMPCAGLKLILVDDVKTTGSTLMECARVLKKAGAERVYALAACADELPYGG